MNTFTISGRAMPYSAWIEPDYTIDAPDTLALRFLPGAFAHAIRRTDVPPSRITIDHIIQKDRMHVLHHPGGGVVTFIDRPDGLYFQASGVSGRVYGLVERKWIQHCCLEMTLPNGARFPHGSRIEVQRVSRVGDLGLILFARPHCRGTLVKAGPLDLQPCPVDARQDDPGFRVEQDGSDVYAYRLVDGAAAGVR